MSGMTLAFVTFWIIDKLLACYGFCPLTSYTPEKLGQLVSFSVTTGLPIAYVGVGTGDSQFEKFSQTQLEPFA